MHYDPMTRSYVLDQWDAQPPMQTMRQPQQIAQPQGQVQAQQMAMALSNTSRPVSSREEAMGVPADFNGTLMVFPDVTHKRVYIKRWDYNAGAAAFEEYALVNPSTELEKVEKQAAPTQIPAYATVDDIKSLEERISALENRKCSCEEKAATVKASKKKEEPKNDE